MRTATMLRGGLAALFVAGIGAVALWPEATDVDLVAATRGPLRVTIDEDGETRVRERYVVSAPVSGRLRRVDLDPGDAVIAGQVVVRLAPTDAPLIDSRASKELEQTAAAFAENVNLARAERSRATAAFERASASERRLESLVEIGAVSREDFETAQTQRAMALTAVTAADHAVARAEREWQAAVARLQRPSNRGGLVDVVAPAGGVVLKRLHESEAVVAAGEPLIEIGDPHRLEIVVDLLSADAVRVRRDAAVSIERWGGDRPIAGRVRRIEPSGFTKVSALGVDEQRVNVIVGFDDPCAGDELGDGYRVDVRIDVWRSEDALVVPLGALFRDGADWAVFVDDHSRARRKVIQLGQRNDDAAEITSGLSAGDRVVMHPPDSLVDGSRIRPRQKG